MSGPWNVYIIVLVVVQVIGALWLLQALTSHPKDENEGGTTGHTWDGDLVENNNPLPRWWLLLFWMTAVWMVGYLIVYPGFGGFTGVTGWTQQGQYEEEIATAEARYGDIYGAFADIPLNALSKDADAVRLGRNLFLNNCSTCHGSDGRGAKGFPNLVDGVWQYGGSAETIQQTITNGRFGIMPALGAALGDAGMDSVVAYLLSLSGRGDGNETNLADGQQKYLQLCSACHGAQGQGTPALGAPGFSDNAWLHGSGEADIRDVIMRGRNNRMPAQKDHLTEDRIRTLVAYVLSLNKS